MRALIVYESMFGHTRDIASAIAYGLAPALSTDVMEVNEAPPMPGLDVDLLIVGAPTHIFGLSNARTRAAVARRGSHPPMPAGIGLREWLDALPPATQRRDALAFDTRLQVRGLPGSAAKDAVKRLRRRGYRMLWPCRSFQVTNPSGSLAEPELERAQLWGRWIADGIAVKHAGL